MSEGSSSTGPDKIEFGIAASPSDFGHVLQYFIPSAVMIQSKVSGKTTLRTEEQEELKKYSNPTELSLFGRSDPTTNQSIYQYLIRTYPLVSKKTSDQLSELGTQFKTEADSKKIHAICLPEHLYDLPEGHRAVMQITPEELQCISKALFAEAEVRKALEESAPEGSKGASTSSSSTTNSSTGGQKST